MTRGNGDGGWGAISNPKLAPRKGADPGAPGLTTPSTLSRGTQVQHVLWIGHPATRLEAYVLWFNFYDPRSIHIYTVGCVRLQWLFTVMQDGEFVFPLFRAGKLERCFLHAFLRRRSARFASRKLMRMDDPSVLRIINDDRINEFGRRYPYANGPRIVVCLLLCHLLTPRIRQSQLRFRSYFGNVRQT
jgi:hypothetical protein